MSVHEQFAEDLAMHALGALDGEPARALREHLEQCPSCRRQLEQLRGDAALLALSASGPKPPARARARLMNAISKEPRLVPVRRPLQWGAALGWLAAAAMIVSFAILWKQNLGLKSTAERLAGTVERQRVELEAARREAEILKAPDAAHYEVLPVGLKTPPPPSGKAIYSRQRGGLIFMASNLRPVAANKAYELWLVPTAGAPIPAGVFKPDSRGRAIVINPPLPAGVEAKAFAITVEPQQGSPAPTTPIIMIGTGG
jgi:anti-sigma factor RsiW